MELLDILKNILKNRNEKTNNSKVHHEIKKTEREERNEMVCGYQDEKRNYIKGYDSTRAIIDKNGKEINGEILYDIKVSWYMADETYFGKENPEVPVHVIASIDIERMKDKTYYDYVMKNFLSKNRVMEFIRKSMMTEEELEKERRETGNQRNAPCGRYIGRVVGTDAENLEIKFDQDVGKYMHNQPDMVESREQYRKERLAEKHKEEQAKSLKKETDKKDIQEEDELEK